MDVKAEIGELQTEYDQTMKSVKMLNSGSKNLDKILSSGQSSSNRYGLGFDSSVKNTGQITGIKFVPATVNIKNKLLVGTKVISASTKTSNWVRHYCGKKGHIRPFCYALRRHRFRFQVAAHNL